MATNVCARIDVISPRRSYPLPRLLSWKSPLEEADHAAADFPERRFDAIRPGLLESHAFDLGEDVDAARRLTHLEARPRGLEVLLDEVAEGRAELPKRDQHLARVLRARFDPYVQILRRAWPPVHADRVRPDHEKSRVSAAQCGEQIEEVFVHGLRGERCRRARR
jgi:hypothetical protein